MALVVVLMLISILGLLFGLGGRGNGPSLQTAGESNARNIAYFTAQGALQRGLTELRLDPAYGGKTNGKFPGAGGSTFDIKVVRNNGAKPKRTPAGVDIAPGSTLVMATGRAGSSERVVAGIIEEVGATSDGFAALVEGELKVRGGVVGAFSAPNGFNKADLVEESGKAQLGSLTKEIRVETRVPASGPPIPARVDGNIASPNVDGDISTPEPGVYSLEQGSQLAGETKLDSAPTLPAPPAPAPYLGGPDVLKATGSRTLLPGHYGRLVTSNDAEVFLEPGDYYFAGDFKTFGVSKIHTNGAVRIFVKGRFTSDDDSYVNYSGDPRNCEIVLSGDPDTYGKVGWVSHASYVWARMKPMNGTLGISGTLFGDVQGGGVDVIGDPDGSGALHYFTELGEEGGGGGIGLGGGELRYATTWTVK
jgi:hypothetical protein